MARTLCRPSPATSWLDAMFRVEDAGYPIILTVHDELLCEVDATGPHSVEEFQALMSERSATYEGLPLSVSAWEDQRYVK